LVDHDASSMVGQVIVTAQAPDAYALWVRPEWEALGWTFESRRS